MYIANKLGASYTDIKDGSLHVCVVTEEQDASVQEVAKTGNTLSSLWLGIQVLEGRELIDQYNLVVFKERT
jgi:hypothetical protein